MSQVVAIHQPNFFPWLGFFDKLVRADVFVLLDNVQFQKTGGTWCNRVKIRNAGAARWLTAPVDRAFSGVKALDEMRFDESSAWRPRLLDTLRQAYARAPFRNDCLELVSPLMLDEAPHIAVFNQRALVRLAEALGLDPSKLVRASDLAVPPLKGTELLAAIVRAAGGDTYLSGDGAGGYQDERSYEGTGVTLRLQGFVHPTYPQGQDDFIPGLSIIDALMNVGIDATAALLQQDTCSRTPARS